jgi:hypothetical protein
MRIVREERGQSIPFTVVFLVVLIGMVALVVDVGSWYRAQRQLQTAADAAAIAGAYNLPNVANARTHAAAFVADNLAQNNEPTLLPLFPAPNNPGGMCDAGPGQSNCIAVDLSHQAPGLFAPVLNSVLSSITVSAHAQAALVAPGSVKDVAPIAVQDVDACRPPPAGSCTFPHHATLDFDTSGYQLLDLSVHSTGGPIGGGSAQASVMMDWIYSSTPPSGYPDALPAPAWYAANNGVKNGIKGNNNKGLLGAQAAGTMLLVPVFDTIDALTQAVHVIGWSAFVIDPGPAGVNWTSGTGGNHVLNGNFVQFVANGLPAGSGPSGQNFGVLSISLVG